MRIMIDGHKASTNIRTSKELLLMLKDLSRTFRWKTRYNPAEELVHIMTQDMPDLTTLPIPIIEPTSRRLEGKIICLDAGHGGSDCGSRGPNGTYEKEHTLGIAQQLRNLLEENDASVVMTRTTDDLPPDEDNNSDLTRLAIAEESHADLLLSIHADSFYLRPTARSLIYYYHENARIAADKIAHAILAESTSPAIVCYGSFPLLRYATMTALRADIASLANPEEELWLASQDGRIKIASSLYRGITQFFHV